MKTGKAHFIESTRMRYLLLTLVTLMVSDGLISQYLTTHGLAGEGNPLLQPLAGTGVFLIIKVVSALLVGLILWDVHKTRPKIALMVTLFLVVVYAGIVFSNLAVFLHT